MPTTETRCPSCGEDADVIDTHCSACRTSCRNCGETVSSIETTIVDRWDHWCTSCVEDYAHYCDERDEYSAYVHDHSDTDEDSVSDGLDVHSFDYNPRAWHFLTLPGERTNEFYAIELEVAYNYQARAERTMADIFAGATDCYFKHDGSIENGNCGPGVEIVTQPMSYAYLQGLRATWAKRLEAMRNAQFRSYDTGSCGLHLHVSREVFSATDLIRMQALIYDNAALFGVISQRNGNFRYCAFDNRDATDPRFRVLKAGTARHKKRYRYFDYNPSETHDRRVALNFPNDTPTVEFRFFRGTLNEASFWKAIETVHSVCAFVRESSKTTEAAYLSWLYRRERQYPNLTAFLAPHYPTFAQAPTHRRGTRYAAPQFTTTNN